MLVWFVLVILLWMGGDPAGVCGMFTSGVFVSCGFRVDLGVSYATWVTVTVSLS